MYLPMKHSNAVSKYLFRAETWNYREEIPVMLTQLMETQKLFLYIQAPQSWTRVLQGILFS